MTPGQLRLAFAGTPDLAAYVLERLLTDTEHEIRMVFTQPDRPAGRGRKPRPGPVKQLALKYELNLSQPQSGADLADSTGLEQLDAMIVVAYGLIIPPAVLQAPALGCINIHTSLLPRWRGAAPIQRAIQYGDHETGVTLMKMDAGLDTGPVIAQTRCPIAADETAGSLHDKLAVLGAGILIETLPRIADGSAEAVEQDDTRANYADKITKQEARIDWQERADVLERTVRAFNPAPVAHACLNGQELRIWEANCDMDNGASRAPGKIIAVANSGIVVACGKGRLILKRLQLPGKKPVAVAELLNGRPAFLQT